ncbi:MAG: hypothetical protein NZM11_00770 [Anaerolineales bacterium]|nr:hypothetical protein [Anaerolineales bacterium]
MTDTAPLWHAFTLDTDDDIIRAAFAQRWGAAPERIIRDHALALAGPVPVPDLASEPGVDTGVQVELIGTPHEPYDDPRTDPDWDVPGA